MKQMLYVLILLPILALGSRAQQKQQAPAFTTDERWSLGFHGGANLWINDLNTRRVGPGGDITFRYGFSKRFSVGIMTAYERLISIQYPASTGAESPQRFDYVAAKTASADLVFWYHFPPTMEVRPFMYAGIGGAAYLRQDRSDNYIPEGKYTVNSSVHVPVGFGFEIPTSKSVSFYIDFGGRFMDDYTDRWKGNSIIDETSRPGVSDWYPTGKIGFNFYFGNKEDEDADGDGLTLAEERKYGTNPYNADSDGDGLRDGEEIWRYNTDPLKADSDGDNLNDGDEVLKHKTFPNKPDTDDDGLNDGAEVLRYDTNPLSADTDGDGLSDGDEVLKHGTNPLNADTDSDTLNDRDEIEKYKTNPRDRDTDGGTVDDGTEVTRGSNPLDPKDDLSFGKNELKAEVGKAIVLEGIVFKTGSAVITPVSEEVLSLALNTMTNHPELEVEIRGHTDVTGSRSFNDVLSQRRADSVRMWLVNRGIAASRIKAVGYGQDYPIDTNLTSEGRQKNRRIEFYRTK